MDSDLAGRLNALVLEASRLLDESTGTVRASCAESAARSYRGDVGRVMGAMAAGILFPLWREHPVLEPEQMKSPGSYDPREFEMSPEGAALAAAALRRARELMQEARNLVDGASPDGIYDQGVREVFDALSRAERSIEGASRPGA